MQLVAFPREVMKQMGLFLCAEQERLPVAWHLEMLLLATWLMCALSACLTVC
jgi:hypothetical protein